MFDVALTPADLPRLNTANAQIVVLDVLRATTTIVTALANGAREVRLYDTHAGAIAARDAWKKHNTGPALLAGETNVLKAEGFDLGNSPREFQTHAVGNAAIFHATTNGTKAAHAAHAAGAKKILIGSLLNSAATATAIIEEIGNLDTILLCSGTNGRPSCEDMLGAGAILFSILGQTYRPDLPFSDLAWACYHAFSAVRPRLAAALRLGAGGFNIIDAGLEDDIDACAAIDTRPLVVEVLSANGLIAQIRPSS